MMNNRIVCALLAAALFLAGSNCGAGEAAPVYTADGRLNFPSDYREWIFLTSGIDMSYNKAAASMGHSMFDNVFVPAEFYREFLRTGTWPERTILVMESRVAAEKGSINQRGKFQTAEMMGVEAHVKDSKRFTAGWGFFAFQGRGPAVRIPEAADCYACHRQHGAVDSTFVQFYPTLLGVATQKHTLAAGFKP
jgi:hypothetical protein